MRGRTNIPPRVGGIVNGVITQCMVSEENGISTGDYVQLVDGSAARSESYQDCVNDWTFGPFNLSNGTIATIFYDGSLWVRQTTVGASGFVNESLITELVIEGLGTTISPFSYKYDNIFVIQLEQDRFLIQASSSANLLFATIEYSENIWSTNLLEVQNKPVQPTGTAANYYQDGILFPLSNSKVVFAYLQNVVVGEISDSTIVFGTSENSIQKIPKFVRYANGYIVVGWFDGYIRTYLTSGVEISLINSVLSSYVTWTTYNSVINASQDKLIMLGGGSRSSYASNPNGYMYYTVVVVNADGSMAISENTNAIYYDLTTSSASLVEIGSAHYFEDGRVLITALLIRRGGSSNSYTYMVEKVLYSIGNFDLENNVLEFEDLTPLDSNAINSLNTYGDDFIALMPVETRIPGLLLFIIGAVTEFTSSTNKYIYKTYQYVVKMEQSSLVPISEYPFVKKYVSRINGVAKTTGAEGSVIEVYAPSSLM